MHPTQFKSTFAPLVILLMAALAFTLTFSPAFGAHAGTLYVGSAACADDILHGDSPANPICTIQFAISHAVPGDTLAVAPGTYDEAQLVIDKDLTIVGSGGSKPVIRPTADTGASGDPRGFFLVAPDVDFALSNVEVNGTGFLVYQGIRSRGRLTVTDVDFVHIQYNASGPTYGGMAIAAFGSDAGQDLALSGSTFSQIGRIGALIFGNDTDAVVSGNTYTGKGDGDYLDYAFEVGAGGSASIVGNTVTGNRGVASDESTSAGILVTTYYGGGTAATIQANTLSTNTTGIAVGYDETDTSNVAARFNNIAGNTDFGVSSTEGPYVDAQCNWWGDASGPTHASNPGGTGDAVSDSVSYAPHATAPFPGNGCGGFVTGGGWIDSPAGAFPSPPYTDTTVWDQGFETDTAGWLDIDDSWYSTVTRVSSGTDGIVSATGDWHAVMAQDVDTGPFSRFDQYRDIWQGTWTASVDVYLDPGWALGDGFEYSVAANGSDGNHQRDYIFHVTKDTSTEALLVSGSNNTNFAPREDLENLNHLEITSAGWYTLRHTFRDESGSLAVDLQVLDTAHNVLFTETRFTAADLIPDEVGGNRYGWFTTIDVDGGIAVDNHQLVFPTAVSGKATFSFVAKYKKGRNVPDGQTQFQFNAANLSFHSDTYDWLIVAGQNLAQFKGSGTVNGVPGYDFILTAYDGDSNGDPDAFRIKITGPGGVVYDNKIGADNGITPANTQAIGGGSIVIHTK